MDVTDLPRGLTTRSVFDLHQFDHAIRVAKVLSQSTLIPATFRENVENCLVALELASQMQISVIDVTRNLSFIDGQLGWKAEFIIARINTCGRFEPLEYHFDGDGESRSCHVTSRHLVSGKQLTGTAITWHMVKVARWDIRQDSMWHCMPEQMFSYRAAAFWARLHCPELLHGIRFADEIEDLDAAKASTSSSGRQAIPSNVDAINDLLSSAASPPINPFLEPAHDISVTAGPCPIGAIAAPVAAPPVELNGATAIAGHETASPLSGTPSKKRSEERGITKRGKAKAYHDPLF